MWTAGGLLAQCSAARAEEVPATEAPAPEAGVTWGSVAVTVSGFATAFVVHEACHAAANLAMGNAPSLQRVRFLGLVPFFAVWPGIFCSRGSCTRQDGTPFRPGPLGYATIVSAGLLCQGIGDEIILTARPRIREEQAPFLKGMLLFNTATSVAYGIANLAGFEPQDGDLHGLDQVSRLPHGAFAAVVIGTAALDVARYFLPDSGWLPWLSRGSKAVTIGMIVAF